MIEELYCHHHKGGKEKNFGTWKMEAIGSKVGKCSCCDAPVIVEIYMCPQCTREIYVQRQFPSPKGEKNNDEAKF